MNRSLIVWERQLLTFEEQSGICTMALMKESDFATLGRMIFDALDAMSDLDNPENATKDQMADAYVRAWQRQKEQRLAAEAAVELMKSELADLKRFAKAHHSDEESCRWLHALTVDIPHRIDVLLRNVS